MTGAVELLTNGGERPGSDVGWFRKIVGRVIGRDRREANHKHRWFYDMINNKMPKYTDLNLIMGIKLMSKLIGSNSHFDPVATSLSVGCSVDVSTSKNRYNAGQVAGRFGGNQLGIGISLREVETVPTVNLTVSSCPPEENPGAVARAYLYSWHERDDHHDKYKLPTITVYEGDDDQVGRALERYEVTLAIMDLTSLLEIANYES